MVRTCTKDKDAKRMPHDILNWKPQGTRPKGRPKNQWEEDVDDDLREMGGGDF